MAIIDLYLSRLNHNLGVIRSKLQPKTKIIGVVKANAYGQGVVPIAQNLIEQGIDYLAVAYASEGIALRSAGIDCPIMVFYPQRETFAVLLQHCLEPVLYSRQTWLAFMDCVERQRIPKYPVHIKFNTGLNRIGFSWEDREWLLEQLQQSKLQVESIYSHLAASEEVRPHIPTEKQGEHFQKIRSFFLPHYPNTVFHLLNTSGVFNYPEWQWDAVRVGIGLFGFANRKSWDQQLKPIARLHAPISQIHSVDKGAYVGYNQGWKALRPSQIATLPIGHADGIGREFGLGKGRVIIHGQLLPIIGNVCMDLVMVDVTDCNCSEGDAAIFFDADHTLNEWAEVGGTIPYELLHRLSPRITRVIHP